MLIVFIFTVFKTQFMIIVLLPPFIYIYKIVPVCMFCVTTDPYIFLIINPFTTPLKFGQADEKDKEICLPYLNFVFKEIDHQAEKDKTFVNQCEIFFGPMKFSI